jgi:hypothetical protein
VVLSDHPAGRKGRTTPGKIYQNTGTACIVSYHLKKSDRPGLEADWRDRDYGTSCSESQ